MAQTPSTMLALGTPAADFSLPEPATGKTVSLGDFKEAAALLVVFMCAGDFCPRVPVPGGGGCRHQC
jgi:peroxiredoxin